MWSLLCHCVRARDHCCVLCDITQDLLFTSYSYFEKSCRKKCTQQSRYCGWFWIHCCPKKFKKRIREATDVCLRELKESNKSRFDSYSVRNSVLIISHITFRDCRVHIFPDNLSRNSCIWCTSLCYVVLTLNLQSRLLKADWFASGQLGFLTSRLCSKENFKEPFGLPSILVKVPTPQSWSPE